jgi:hypothetical protein
LTTLENKVVVFHIVITDPSYDAKSWSDIKGASCGLDPTSAKVLKDGSLLIKAMPGVCLDDITQELQKQKKNCEFSIK